MKALTALPLIAAGAALGLSGCSPAVNGRFAEQPIVWTVDDERDIPEPEEREYLSTYNIANVFVFRRFTRAVDPPRQRPALNTNALDEVPNSTWFTNRIGLNRVSADEAARGPEGSGPPQAPLTVTKAKTGGGNPGFFIEDARGSRYLIKFDTPDNPEQQTATDAIVARILWTAGYHVPSDYVFFFTQADLRVAPGITYEDPDTRKKRQLDEFALAQILSSVGTPADGRYRATASEFLPGRPKGGWPAEGRRDDDPNDLIDHESRRELRGLRIFAAWLGHTDMKEDNTLDMYVTEHGDRFLRHYLVDFGEALGGHQSEKGRLEVGWEYGVDWAAQMKGLLSLGLWRRVWERQRRTRWKSIGYFSVEYFDPDEWRELYPYWPFFHVDDADAYWAAKIIIRFDRPLLEAIVGTGMLSQADAAAYLIDTLLARRDKIAAAYLPRVTALDEFGFEGGALCAVELSARYRLIREASVDISVDGQAAQSYKLGADGRICIPVPGGDGYRILRVRTRHADGGAPPMQIHLRSGARPRLLGIIRVE